MELSRRRQSFGRKARAPNENEGISKEICPTLMGLFVNRLPPIIEQIFSPKLFRPDSLGNPSSGPKRLWQPETWQDFTHFSPPGNRTIFSTFWGEFLLNYTEQLEKKDKHSPEKSQKFQWRQCSEIPDFYIKSTSSRLLIPFLEREGKRKRVIPEFAEPPQVDISAFNRRKIKGQHDGRQQDQEPPRGNSSSERASPTGAPKNPPRGSLLWLKSSLPVYLSEVLSETLSEEGFPVGGSLSCCPSSCCCPFISLLGANKRLAWLPLQSLAVKVTFFVPILGGEKLLKFVEMCRWNVHKRPERG